MKTPNKILIVCCSLGLLLGACSSEADAPAAAVQDIERAADDAAAKITESTAEDELEKLKQEVGR